MEAYAFNILRQDGQLLLEVDRSFADAARRSGPHLLCRPGCTQCCHGSFAVNALDALRLRAGMDALMESDPERALRVTRRTEDYLEIFSGEFPGDRKTGILGTSEADEAAFEEFANEAPCPALDLETGLCDLYDARPMTCRVFGPPIRSAAGDEEGLAVCELCFTEASEAEIAAAEMHVPCEEEAMLLTALGNERGVNASTIVAYCLLPRFVSEDATAS